MMKRTLLIVASVFTFLSPIAAAQDVGVLHLRPLHLELPATWRFDGSKNPIEGFGPEGEKLLVTIMRRKPDSTGPVRPAKEIAQGFAKDKMQTLSVKDGKSLIRPVCVLQFRRYPLMGLLF